MLVYTHELEYIIYSLNERMSFIIRVVKTCRFSTFMSKKVSLKISLKTTLYRDHCRIDMSNSRQQNCLKKSISLIFFKYFIMHTSDVYTVFLIVRLLYFRYCIHYCIHRYCIHTHES